MPNSFGLALSASQNLAWNLAESPSMDGGRGTASPPVANYGIWYDASQTTLGSVTPWTDLSGNGHNAIQANPVQRPVCAANQLNGKNGVVFNSGSSQFLATASISPSLTQPNTIFVVSKLNIPIVGGGYVIDGLNNILRNAMFSPGGGNSTFEMTAGTVLNTTRPIDGNAHIHGLVFNGNSSSYSIDGAAAQSGIAGGETLTGLVIGSQYDNAGGTFYNGTIFEIIVYNRLLNSAEIAQVNNYLSVKWGISIAFPLSLNPQVWYDSSDATSITVSPQNTGITGTGPQGQFVLSCSATVEGVISVGNTILLNGTDSYVVNNVAASFLQINGVLATNYTNATISLPKVSQLKDKSGHNLNANQANVSFQPTYIPGAQNGMAVTDFLQLGANMPIGNLSISTGFTQVMMVKLDSSIAAGDVTRRLLSMANNNTALFIDQATSDVTQKALLATQTEHESKLIYTAYDNVSWGIIVSWVSLAGRSIILQDTSSNQTSNTLDTAFQTPTNPFGLGDVVDQSTTPGFQLAELFFFIRVLTLTEYNSLFAYLKAKWNIT